VTGLAVILAPAGHSATAQGANPGYLDHPNTFETVWQPLAQPKILEDLTRALTVPGAPAPHPPSHRALLIGINAYPDPINQLNGCASDTYRVSELLQENGFVAENIRLLTDERATRDAILDRLHWLLDDVADESMAVRQAYSGTSGTTYKLGRALPLRRLDDEEYDKVRDLRGHKGPFLPVVLEACRENQLSYEYTNGSTTNGAFTYALVQEYRRVGRRRAATSFIELIRKTRIQIKRLGYEEQPQLIGPSDVIKGPIPRAIPVANES